jgi:hypothetical protein
VRCVLSLLLHTHRERGVGPFHLHPSWAASVGVLLLLFPLGSWFLESVKLGGRWY